MKKNYFKKEYYEISKKIINKSYPKLKNKKIIILEGKINIFKGMAIWPLPWIRIIIIHINTRNKDRKYKTALLAHELAHLDLFQKNSWICYLFEFFKYISNEKFRSKTEWDTEKHVIKKGYAKENYHYVKDGGPEREKLRKKYGYMTSKDIKEYAIKINKWN